MSDPQLPNPAADDTPVSTRAAVVKAGLFLLVLVAAGLALRYTPLSQVLDREWVVAQLSGLREAWWSPLALIGAYVLLCPLGSAATPLFAAGGVVFGPLWGSLYNLIGSWLGAVASYLLARGLGHDFVVRIFGDKLQRFEKQLSRHGFWALARIRYLPIPFPMVNFGSALVGVKPKTFVFSTLVGLLLPVPIWTYFWATVFNAAEGETTSALRNVFISLAALLALTFIPRLLIARKRRRRLLELRALRSQRIGSEGL
ncbi:MAG: VTT domain-containing protein [Acidobacteriota bacterium]